MNQQETIAAITAADISETDWTCPIFEAIDSGYARGYLAAKNESLTNHLGSNSEEYRQELLEICGWSIWS